MNNYPFYSDNPGLKLRTVVTVTGATEYRANCRSINNEMYAMNKDCFFIDGKWIRVNSGLILFDYETKEWFKKEYGINRRYGVVDFNDGQPILGYFTPNPYNNVLLYIRGGSSKVWALSAELLFDNGCIEDVGRGEFYMKSDLSENSIKKISTPRTELDHTRRQYNIEENAEDFERKVAYYENYKPKMSKDVRAYGRFLQDTTFGIELETIRGHIPEYVQNRSGVVICRDGSLRSGDGRQGAEFVTVPMEGAKGLQNIVNLCAELNKRTEIDINCSVHIHLGNLPTTRIYLVSLYMLCYKIQDELFTMFPYYKTNPEGVKRMNWNQKLRKLGMVKMKPFCKEDFNTHINEAYERLFLFLTEGARPSISFNKKNKRHPQTAKWNMHSRYYWINFINSIFSNRGTYEFRPHPGSLNPQKIVNWLFIVNAICKYASANSRKILATNEKISMEMVLNYYKNTFTNSKAEFLSNYLNAYFTSRKTEFKKDFDNGDRVSAHDIYDDKTYLFNFEGVTHLF